MIFIDLYNKIIDDLVTAYYDNGCNRWYCNELKEKLAL
ncbi:hypothetical protein LVISKB_0109 [Levilactobacillus brevis KB290]|uniref:Uncharacterized protein n=1 Tax=Levilactobacillus brevis KB290 TaxID=1001583 RepID=M5AAB7_LEVBR|nr:hypothetical protein LVISKB_0109 [Levilactobacillus brevis KB290]